jgi:hypothetical protein
MKQKTLTVSFAPSSLADVFPIYAVNPNALGCRIEGIQIANDSPNTQHTCTVARIEYEKKYATNINYFGDGSTIRSQDWNYDGSAYAVLLRKVKIPASTALSVLDIPMYLKPKDVLSLKPTSDDSGSIFKPTVTVTEFFDDDADASTTVDISTVFTLMTLGTY